MTPMESHMLKALKMAETEMRYAGFWQRDEDNEFRFIAYNAVLQAITDMEK